MPISEKKRPPDHDLIAPDRAEVRILLRMSGGNMAHLLLPVGHHESLNRPDSWARIPSGTAPVAG
jgi:hypothetical protein